MIRLFGGSGLEFEHYGVRCKTLHRALFRLISVCCRAEQRERSLFEITDGMRLDLNRMPKVQKANVLAGGVQRIMGGQSTLDVEIYGYDFNSTDKIASELRERISKIPGLVDVKVSRDEYNPNIRLNLTGKTGASWFEYQYSFKLPAQPHQRSYGFAFPRGW